MQLSIVICYFQFVAIDAPIMSEKIKLDGMQRVNVGDTSGCGKSTFSKRLTVIQVDRVYTHSRTKPKASPTEGKVSDISAKP